MFKTLAALTLIGAACGLLLFAMNDITRGDIERNRTQKARAIMAELLKQPLPDKILWVDDISGSCQLGYFIKHAENGYSGPINFLPCTSQTYLLMKHPAGKLPGKNS